VSKPDINKILTENKKRLAELYEEYNPYRGIGSPIERFKFAIPDAPEGFTEIHLPESMKSLAVVSALLKFGSIKELAKNLGKEYSQGFIDGIWEGITSDRFDHDFEFWAAFAARIQDKKTKRSIPFILRKAQRKLLRELEEMRLAGIPIRIILLKARQWGGSTLVQIYMDWIQLRIKKNWHSAIIADVEDQARNIRGMQTKLAELYPESLGTITFKPFEGSSKNKVIADRGCIIGVGSAQKPESLRSFDFAMVHMSEVGLWKSTPNRSAEDLVQSVRATIPDEPLSLEVLESTAKGVGNFFHREWQAAYSGRSGYKAVFVGWWEIDMYQMDIDNYKTFIKTMDDYDWFLWELGATLEGIHWYKHTKASKNYDDWRMKSEYPSTADEAFQSSGQRYFKPKYVIQARKTCRPPRFIGELFADGPKKADAFKGLDFDEVGKGNLFVWELPDEEEEVTERYVVVVDIGGKTENADWSIIKVFDRFQQSQGGVPEVVATWRGHLDQDLVVWKAAQIARFYHNALLVVESNSLHKEKSEGDFFLTVLDEIADYYDNIFHRTDPTKIKQGLPPMYGFHTNKSTKTMVLVALNAALREIGYYERDSRTCDEMDYYETKPNGTVGAVEGEHDDLVMATAIGVWVCVSYLDLPKPKPKRKDKTSSRKRSGVVSSSVANF
jgi:hypothetical protein